MDMTQNVAGKVVGNTYAAESSVGFKADIQNMIERYALENVDITRDFERILARDNTRSDFIDRVTESVSGTEALSDSSMVGDSFYGNYGERLSQLIDNSCKQIARESVMTGYAPIVSYAPFFIKKQWVACVWKDVLMSEVTTTPIINYKFEKRYLKDMEGNRYAIPDVYYDKDTMAKLYAASTGLDIDNTVEIPMADAANLNVLATVDGLPTGRYLYLVNDDVSGRLGVMNPKKDTALTPDTSICMVKFTQKLKATTEGTNTTYALPTPAELEAGTGLVDATGWVATNIRIDITTHAFVKGEVTWVAKVNVGGNAIVALTADGKPIEVRDEIVGNIDFDNATVHAFSTQGKITGIKLAGKTANRFNHRSIDVERRVEQLQYVMPESGPRLNSAVTVEEAADAIALGRIDMFADNVDMMGDALANINDFQMRNFVDESWNAQQDADAAGTKLHGYEKLTEQGGFNAIPYAGYATNISTWMTDAKEYFERFLENLKQKLNTPEMTVVCVCNPALVRYIRAEIKWVFSDQTDVSGLKIQYNLGVTTIAGDRVHIISCRYLQPEDGIQTILIPTTTELITFKNIFYSVVVDRGYRNPTESLVPNIMSTQRTLTFEVLPVQGRFYIDGRDATPPANLSTATRVINGVEQSAAHLVQHVE